MPRGVCALAVEPRMRLSALMCARAHVRDCASARHTHTTLARWLHANAIHTQNAANAQCSPSPQPTHIQHTHTPLHTPRTPHTRQRIAAAGPSGCCWVPGVGVRRRHTVASSPGPPLLCCCCVSVSSSTSTNATDTEPRHGRKKAATYPNPTPTPHDTDTRKQPLGAPSAQK